MRIAFLVLPIIFLSLTGCAKYYRLSVEGGTTVDFFASQHHNTPYGVKGRDGVVSLAATDVAAIEGFEMGISAVRWSGPYTENTLVGADVGYRLANDHGYFGRVSIGPYYGDETVRTSSHWTFGIKTAVGLTFNGGKNEFYAGFRHFSNGSSLGIGEKPNMVEEFLNCGVSCLF